MKLYQAISDIVERYGLDAVARPTFLNILMDYQAFDRLPSRGILKSFIDDGYFLQLLSMNPSGEHDRYREAERLGRMMELRHGYQSQEVKYVIDSLCYGLKWSNTAPVNPSGPAVAPIAATPRNWQIHVGPSAFKMIYVQGGTFTMGATPEQGIYASYNEKPPVQATVSDFYMAEVPVTQQLWQYVMGSNPSHFNAGGSLPVERVTWHECWEFIKKLNSMTEQSFRLPTEAEWEYAARGGTKGRQAKYAGCGDSDKDTHMWYKENSGGTTHEVKSLSPNELGLYDMSGNVSEWCNDGYFGSYIAQEVTHNFKVYRGGSWFDPDKSCRVAKRFCMSAESRGKQVGMRLAATVIQ